MERPNYDPYMGDITTKVVQDRLPLLRAMLRNWKSTNFNKRMELVVKTVVENNGKLRKTLIAYNKIPLEDRHLGWKKSYLRKAEKIKTLAIIDEQNGLVEKLKISMHDLRCDLGFILCRFTLDKKNEN